MKIAIGSDHVGYSLKLIIIDYLAAQGYEVKDFGADSEASSDYPVYAYRVAHAVTQGEFPCGILICGTGIGISIAANKVPGIRAAVCSEAYSARMTKRHNNANIIAFGARVVGEDVAKDIVTAFLQEEFEGGRHQRRLDMIQTIIDGKPPQ